MKPDSRFIQPPYDKFTTEHLNSAHIRTYLINGVPYHRRFIYLPNRFADRLILFMVPHEHRRLEPLDQALLADVGVGIMNK